MLQNNIHKQYVSLAEVFEVRDAKLNEYEILIILLTTSDYLITNGLPEEESSGLFTFNQILLTNDGQIIVCQNLFFN